MGPAGQFDGTHVRVEVSVGLFPYPVHPVHPVQVLVSPARQRPGWFQTGFTGFTGWGLPAEPMVPMSGQKRQSVSSLILFILIIPSKFFSSRPGKGRVGISDRIYRIYWMGCFARTKPGTERSELLFSILFILFILSKTPVPTPLRRPLAVRNGGNLRWGS
jgi:hypothetical protein